MDKTKAKAACFVRLFVVITLILYFPVEIDNFYCLTVEESRHDEWRRQSELATAEYPGRAVASAL